MAKACVWIRLTSRPSCAPDLFQRGVTLAPRLFLFSVCRHRSCHTGCPRPLSCVGVGAGSPSSSMEILFNERTRHIANCSQQTRRISVCLVTARFWEGACPLFPVMPSFHGATWQEEGEPGAAAWTAVGRDVPERRRARVQATATGSLPPATQCVCSKLTCAFCSRAPPEIPPHTPPRAFSREILTCSKRCREMELVRKLVPLRA